MKEKYEDFLKRIAYQFNEQFSEGSSFAPDKGLFDKVGPDNRFRPFYGDTVVFDLDENVKARVVSMIKKLYDTVPECFCEKLGAETVHMTMHDLSASVSERETAANEEKLKAVLRAKPFRRQLIRMKTNRVLNMVGRSLVLTLLPENGDEWDKLQELYSLIDNVKKCDYPFFTPHITLGYYNYHGFDNDSRLKLREVINELNRDSVTFTLSADKLYYQHFTDMNSYENIFLLTDR